jgi:hypothetical protein
MSIWSKIWPEPRGTYKLSPDRDVPLTIFFFFLLSFKTLTYQLQLLKKLYADGS